ncbi:MAG: hypothetical protein CFH01_01485 [Alphaproteobacteria bacterium MarineAlpha2_Bin1]|nr:MAG: hypothetical protein CFH01_01485 [Alphaproteobacteria bacterium MarineAlpha2_Bin1]
MNKKNFCYILLLISGTGFGSVFIANKYVAISGLPTTAYLFWFTFVGSALTLIPVLLSKKKYKFSFLSIVHFPAAASLGMLVPFGVVASIADKLPAGVLTLSFSLGPAFTFLLSFFFRMERFRYIKIFGIILGFIGVCFIVFPETSLPNPESAPWIIFALLAPIGAASNNIIVAKLKPPNVSPIFLTFYLLFSATIIMFVIMVINHGFIFFWDYGNLAILGVCWATIVQVIGFIIMYIIIPRVGPVFFSQIAYVMIFSGFLWAYIFFREVPSIWIIFAIMFMTIGLIFTNSNEKKLINF